MEPEVTMPLPYSIGTVLAGYLMMLPFWLMGAAWNRFRPERTLNPWILPALWNLFLYICFAITTAGFSDLERNDMVVIVGILPAALGSLGAAWRWRSRQRGSF